jgi:hypothetical protein
MRAINIFLVTKLDFGYSYYVLFARYFFGLSYFCLVAPAAPSREQARKARRNLRTVSAPYRSYRGGTWRRALAV